MKFSDVAPRLRMAYSASELVPFIGAGMSIPACTGWQQFVEQLEREARSRSAIAAASHRTALPVSGSALIERADRAVQFLSHLGDQELVAACRRALIGEHPDCVPAQIKALAETYWPIVLSTNYDDWYASYARARPLILGRSRSDCQTVLARLEVNGPPILWALQGYVGGQSDRPLSLPRGQIVSLGQQLVVGHRQYQKVMHRDVHFRRAFSEIFRRRSLLFLGSGLQEDYLLNLFGEILEHYGPNSRPHFAFLRSCEASERAAFLLSRLNITVIEYETYAQLPDILQQLGDALRTPRVFQGVGALAQQRFSLDGESGAYLGITVGTLPVPLRGECAAVSLGRDEETGRLLVGRMAQDFLGKLGSQPLANGGWHKVPGAHYTYRYSELPVFGVASRSTGDHRDLRLLAPATSELILEAANAGFSVLHVGLIAAGSGRDWHPNFSLIEMVRGARRFVSRRSTACPSVQIHVVEPKVIFSLQAGELPIAELLSCEEIRFWVEIVNADGDRERHLTFQGENVSIGELVSLFSIPVPGWTVETLPPPFAQFSRRPLEEVAGTGLGELGVVHGAILRFAKE
jgi:hypothetical protein